MEKHFHSRLPHHLRHHINHHAKRVIEYLKGFSLVEIIIVIALLAITISGTIFLINPLGQYNKAQDVKRQHDVAQIRTALATYFADRECYPSSLAILPTPPAIGAEPYIKQLPKDPQTNTDYLYRYDTANASCPKWGVILSTLANAKSTAFSCPARLINPGCLVPSLPAALFGCGMAGDVICPNEPTPGVPGSTPFVFLLPTNTPVPPTNTPTPTPATGCPWGLVSYWKMDETSGTTVADAVGGRTGTSTSGTNIGTGILGSKGRIQGTNDVISVPVSAPLNNLPQGTASIWFKPNYSGAPPGPYGGSGIAILYENYNSYGLGHGAYGGNDIYVLNSNGIGEQYLDLGTWSHTANTWYHFVLKWDALGGKLFINNMPFGGTIPGTFGGNSGNVFKIGNDQYFNDGSMGTIDELGIWNRALTDGPGSEIERLWNSGSGIACP